MATLRSASTIRNRRTDISPITILPGSSWKAHTHASVEHCYQSYKFDDRQHRTTCRQLPEPNDTKRYAHSHKMLWRPDWEEVKVAVMQRAIHAKFNQNPGLYYQLLATGNALLEEDSPRDLFWGIGRDGLGGNMLGVILMGCPSYISAYSRPGMWSTPETAAIADRELRSLACSDKQNRFERPAPLRSRLQS